VGTAKWAWTMSGRPVARFPQNREQRRWPRRVPFFGDGAGVFLAAEGLGAQDEDAGPGSRDAEMAEAGR